MPRGGPDGPEEAEDGGAAAGGAYAGGLWSGGGDERRGETDEWKRVRFLFKDILIQLCNSFF